jgi:hypothetical protein
MANGGRWGRLGWEGAVGLWEGGLGGRGRRWICEDEVEVLCHWGAAVEVPRAAGPRRAPSPSFHEAWWKGFSHDDTGGAGVANVAKDEEIR